MEIVEIGFFKYNHLTNRLAVRGNQNKVWAFFTPWLQKQMEIFEAQQKVVEQMNWDGTIKDLDAFKNAIGEYRRLKLKYGM